METMHVHTGQGKAKTFGSRKLVQLSVSVVLSVAQHLAEIQKKNILWNVVDFGLSDCSNIDFSFTKCLFIDFRRFGEGLEQCFFILGFT